MTINKLKPGMVVYDMHKHRMGNTTLTSWGVWFVRIISVNQEEETVVASWNSNPATTHYKSEWSKWRIKKPEMVRDAMGRERPLRRGEKP